MNANVQGKPCGELSSMQGSIVEKDGILFS